MRDIEILKFSDDGKSSTFTIPAVLNSISGKNGLAQRIAKIMFTQIGSDFYVPDSGTVFYELLKIYREDEIENVQATFPVILQKLEEQIKRGQTQELISGKKLKDNEILDSLSLKSSAWDSIFGGWLIVIEVNTRSGEQTYIQVP